MLDSEISLIEKLEKDYQNNEYENGLKLIEENLSLINKKYYEITKYKIIFLFKINKLIDAFVIIKEELNVPYIPRDFEIFLKEMQKKIFYELHNSNDKKLTIDDLDNIDKLSNDQLSVVIPSLKNFNLYVLLDKIKTILLKKDITNLNKTLIIAILTDFKINENFNVLKDDEIISFNPVELKDIRECDDFKYFGKKN